MKNTQKLKEQKNAFPEKVNNLKDQSQNRSNLSSAARNKIINRSGSNYLSERLNEINPAYGPHRGPFPGFNACQAIGCPNIIGRNETYCEVCKPIQTLNRKVENKTSIRPVKDTVEFTT